MVALLGGCATTAPITNQPMTARPVAPAPAAQSASLFSDSTFRPLFEDARARRVGDVLMVVISESNSASKTSSTDASRKSSMSAAVPLITGLPFKGLQGLSASATSDYSFSGAGDAAMTNAFSGNLTVTVVEVLSNGNLVVSGEKQVAINHGNEFVRFSGVVSPVHIVANAVRSAQVADAKLEFRQDGAFDAAQTQGWLSRFFMSVSPF